MRPLLGGAQQTAIGKLPELARAGVVQGIDIHSSTKNEDNGSEVSCILKVCAPVAQMDRAFASGAKGRRFESCQAHQPQVFQEVAWLLDRYHMLTTVCDKSKGSQTTNVCRNPRMRATCLC